MLDAMATQRREAPNVIRKRLVQEALAEGRPIPPTDRERRAAARVERLARAGEERERLSQEMRAATDFRVEQQRHVLNLAFVRLVEFWSDDDELRPRDSQALAIATGIIIDKRRLIDGEATSRHETMTDAAAAELADRQRKSREEAARLLDGNVVSLDDVRDATTG